MSITTTARLFPRRNLQGVFAQPVREDGWRESDLAGQQSAQQLSDLGATGVYVNTFGVAYGVIDGTTVLVSEHNPAVTNYDGSVLVIRKSWSMQTGNYLRVEVAA